MRHLTSSTRRAGSGSISQDAAIGPHTEESRLGGSLALPVGRGSRRAPSSAPPNLQSVHPPQRTGNLESAIGRFRTAPSGRAQLRQERNLCRNQSQRRPSPVAGGIFTGHHSSSGHTEKFANSDQAASDAPVLLATPESLKKHGTIDRPLQEPVGVAALAFPSRIPVWAGTPTERMLRQGHEALAKGC